jgi:membrane protease YdiL (CAAX protease family)
LLSGISSLIVFAIPGALHGSVAQRFLLSISGGVIGEWLLVIALWLVLRSRNQSFRDLGTWQFGNWAAWGLALLLAGLSIASNLRFLPRMHIPIADAFAPRGFHLVAAIALGITAGFCEEVLFRGFLMTEFAYAGYGKFAQVILPGVAFGFAHLGYAVHGIIAAAGIMVPTALLGMMWGVAYLLGRRALVPCIVAHFLNDSTALPWILFFLSSRNPSN